MKGGKFEAACFSFGPRNMNVSSRDYKESVVKNSGLIGNRSRRIALVEYVSLFLSRNSYMYSQRHKSVEFKGMLAKFRSDVIITNYETIDNAVQYKSEVDGKVKIISLTDDLNQISQYLDSIKSRVEKRGWASKIFYKAGLRTVGSYFISFLTKKYEKMLEHSNYVVLFTEGGVLTSKNAYPNFSSKFVSILPPLVKIELSEISKVRKKVRNVLFLGVWLSSNY